MTASTTFELVAIGRVGMDLYPEQDGPLWSVSTFSKSLGGTAANVAVAASRLGHSAALASKVGDDRVGEYVRRALEGFGVDTSLVGVDARYKTPLVIAELDPRENPGLEFYREPTAPDLQLTTEELADTRISDAAIVWATGTGLSDEPSASATLTAMQRRATSRTDRRWTILDLDWRPMLWGAVETAHDRYREALRHATVVVGNREEVSVALGEPLENAAALDEHTAAERLLEFGVELVVVKLGANGVLLASANERVQVAPIRIPVVCGLGAGDAFGGALVHSLLSGWPLEQTGAFCNAAGAYVASQLACADAMPTEQQLNDWISTQ